MFIRKRPEITKIFTPRQSDVNSEMYVGRPGLEKKLARSLKRNSHSLLFGDSGNGKSWLYKKVLSDRSIPYVIANCGNASRLQSITQEICYCLIEPGTVSKLGFSEEKAAEISAYVAKGGLSHTSDYSIAQDEPLLKAFKLFNEARPGRKIVVLDNLETIFDNPSLMNELADIIILLDDNRYAECEVNFLIVGTPANVLEYFSKTKNSESVANRIQEVDKVNNLDSFQVEQIVRKGFSLLQVSLSDSQVLGLADYVMKVTLGIAQRVHEYCEYLAYEIEDNDWHYDDSLLEQADVAWLKTGLRKSYQVIEGHLNSRATAVARRNQVIFCIGSISKHNFDSNHIDYMVRSIFPSTVPATNMGIGSILSELSSGVSPLLKRHASSNSYSIRDPRYLMCIRLALYKDPSSEKVIKKGFKI
ncbi:MAG: AAA family ATPase [Halomonas sp.]|nr:AAA family ATPase [Halomonas sp.]MCC5882497.1 AAA family ATPase [Halomonas sp.]